MHRVTQRRTSQDWAHFIRELVDIHYPKAEKIVLVMDNLNTHTPSSLYQTLPPEQARRLLKKLEIHINNWKMGVGAVRRQKRTQNH